MSREKHLQYIRERLGAYRHSGGRIWICREVDLEKFEYGFEPDSMNTSQDITTIWQLLNQIVSLSSYTLIKEQELSLPDLSLLNWINNP